MDKINFYKVDKAEKEAVFNAIAAKYGMKPFAVEKDWWVSRTLEIIFQMEVAKHLVFKGGTSLSKAWKLINRFSEDIDLAIDRDFFEGYQGNISKTKIRKLRKEAGVYTTETFFKNLEEEFIKRGFNNLEFKIVESGESDQDPRVLEIYYSNVIPALTTYILPRVQIEVSCRSLREPFSIKSFGSLVDEEYFDREFAVPLFAVPTVDAERTLLEKLFLLHEEFQRPGKKIRVNRLSRHLYDIYHLTKVDNGPEFIANKLQEWAANNSIEITHIQPGKPTQNSLIERFNRTFRQDVLDSFLFKNLKELRKFANYLPLHEFLLKYGKPYVENIERFPTFQQDNDDKNQWKYLISKCS